MAKKVRDVRHQSHPGGRTLLWWPEPPADRVCIFPTFVPDFFCHFPFRSKNFCRFFFLCRKFLTGSARDPATPAAVGKTPVFRPSRLSHPFCNTNLTPRPVLPPAQKLKQILSPVCKNTPKLRPLKCPQTAINGPPAASFFGIHQLPVLPEIGPKKREYVNLLFRPIAKIRPIRAWF